MSDVIKNRYDFVVLFDVENGNPNGIRMPEICREWIWKAVMES